jgi:hypothetical protein
MILHWRFPSHTRQVGQARPIIPHVSNSIQATIIFRVAPPGGLPDTNGGLRSGPSGKLGAVCAGAAVSLAGNPQSAAGAERA